MLLLKKSIVLNSLIRFTNLKKGLLVFIVISLNKSISSVNFINSFKNSSCQLCDKDSNKSFIILLFSLISSSLSFISLFIFFLGLVS